MWRSSRLSLSLSALLPARTPACSVLRTQARGLAKKAKKKGKGAAKAKGGGRSSGEGSGEDVVNFQGVSKVLPGGRVLLDDVSLKVMSGAKVGVLGANGAGKSTVLRLMSGAETDYEGRILRRGNISMAMLEQEPQLDEASDVMSNVMDGLRPQKLALERFDEVTRLLADGSAASGEEEAALVSEQGSHSARTRPTASVHAFSLWRVHCVRATGQRAGGAD